MLLGLLLSSTLAMAGPREQVFEYNAPAADVAVAWAEAVSDAKLGGRAPETFAGKYVDASPIEGVDDTLLFKGRTVLGVLEYRVEGGAEIRSEGLLRTVVTLTFDPTNTLGEQGAWKKLGTKFDKHAREWLEESSEPATESNVRWAVIEGLTGAPACFEEVKRVQASPFGLTDWVADALPIAAVDCGIPLALALADSAEHREVGISWLVDAAQRAEGDPREQLLAALRKVPKPTVEIRQILTEENARKVAEAEVVKAQAEAAKTQAESEAAALRERIASSNGARYGGWTVKVETSQIDDSTTVDLSLPANTSISAWPGGAKRPVLHVRCMEGQQEVYIWTGYGPEIESHNHATLTIRLDDEEAREVLGSVSSSREGTFFPGASGFARELAGAERLVFRYTPFQSEPVTTTFSITGLSESLPLVKGACS